MHVYGLEEAAKCMGAMPGDPPHGQKHGQIAGHWKMTLDWGKNFGLVKNDYPMEAGVDTSVIKAVVEMSKK